MLRLHGKIVTYAFFKKCTVSEKQTQNACILRLLIPILWCTFETGRASLLRLKNNVEVDISEENFDYDVEAYCIRCQEVQKQQEKNQGKQKDKSYS